jgi:hypothetical protein
MFQQVGHHLQGSFIGVRSSSVNSACKIQSLTFNVILRYFNNYSKDSCVQFLQDPASLTFNTIFTYGRLSAPYASDSPLKMTTYSSEHT